MSSPGNTTSHLERSGEAVGRDEPEGTRGPGVPAAGDEHRAGAIERRPARGPVDVGEKRMGRAPVTVRGKRTLVARGRLAPSCE